MSIKKPTDVDAIKEIDMIVRPSNSKGWTYFGFMVGNVNVGCSLVRTSRLNDEAEASLLRVGGRLQSENDVWGRKLRVTARVDDTVHWRASSAALSAALALSEV
ncbi:MAG: hypothetical protein HKM24_07770 [Gammaproteobacteria bacterium]|nr:hypothetical protein [Gammaproteobacteria bacterium]